MTTHPLKTVKLNKYYELSGDTPNAVRNRKKRGKWLDGVQTYIAPDGNLWVDLTEVELWVTKNYRTSTGVVKRSKRPKA